MTELQIKRKDFLAYRSGIAFSLSRLASAAIQILMLFRSTWLCETGFCALLGRKNKPRNKQIVEQDLWFALAARAR